MKECDDDEFEICDILDYDYVSRTGLRYNLKCDNQVIEEYKTREEAENDLSYMKG